jgi:hypothetical protein
MAIVARSALSSLEHKVNMLAWQATPLSFTKSGYGKRIPTAHMVKLPGCNRWRRVYCACFSNSGTCYIEVKKAKGEKPDWHVIHPF